MEHNHNPLIYGFLLSFFMFGLGITMGYVSVSGVDWQSKVTIQIFGGLFIVAGIIMLKKTFQTRDECPICKNKFNFGKKQ